jgi:hypothetical protein
MNAPRYGSFQERVEQAAAAALKQKGSVGPLELFQFIGFLHPVHVEAWRKGNESYPNLEQWIQAGPDKLRLTLHHFHEWVKVHGLQPVTATYARRGLGGIEELRATADGDPEREKFYRTHYAPANLTSKKAQRLEEKLKKAPELVVFEKVSEEGNCTDCGAELGRGAYLVMEKGKPLCLTCTDLDQLEFLPAGNTALTRRARKHSPLSAVVVRFSRARKRYERQGLLVTPAAIAKAEEECAADAPERALARSRAAALRLEVDREFIASFTEAILNRFPTCPPNEAQEIASHAGLRSSGRVGRSAAGRELDPNAVDLAVIAHVRHAHTDYDRLLMSGSDRQDARALVRELIDRVLAKWRESAQVSG